MKISGFGLLVFVQICTVLSYPVHNNYQGDSGIDVPKHDIYTEQSHKTNNSNNRNGEIISVRITSSVAIERGHSKSNNTVLRRPKIENRRTKSPHLHISTVTETPWRTTRFNPSDSGVASEYLPVTITPPSLEGANIEFIKQLNAKKEAKTSYDELYSHPYELNFKNHKDDVTDEHPEKSQRIVNFPVNDNEMDNLAIPRARSIPLSILPKNHLLNDYSNHQFYNDKRNNSKLTTVSFNIVHDLPDTVHRQNVAVSKNSYNQPEIFRSESSNFYSEPSKIYSEPAKVYGEPAKVYGEPAKVYSEPAKVYGEPSKVYGEPAKFYSQPASLHLPEKTDIWVETVQSTTTSTTIQDVEETSQPNTSRQNVPEHLPEKNYEIDESISVLTNGRTHGVQESTTDNFKVGYVVEGRQYRKYRVEERTPDGFIVGEYGVVRNEDGALRGVRYTADGEASPRLIYDALMKFLQLK